MSAYVSETSDYVLRLIVLAVRSAMQNRRVFIVLNVLMLVQNILFFSVWIIFFSTFSSLRGWELADMATLFGMAAFSFGVAFLFSGGTMDIGRMIADGELDVHLGRPRHPLYTLIFRESRLSGLGDMLTGPVLWLWLGGYGLIDLIPLLAFGILAAVIVLATALAINSLPFFMSRSSRLTDRILDAFVLITSFPHHGLTLSLKVILLTIIPAGFIAMVPVWAMREADWSLLGVMAVAAFIYLTIAVQIFNYGLRRYASGNKMADLR